MNQYTGEILSEEDLKKLSKEKQSQFIPIPQGETEKVRGMNRAERRAWANQQKRKRM